MDSNAPPSGGSPPKPWERAGNPSSNPAPFKPSSAGNTSAVVEASGTANSGEIVPAFDASNRSSLGRPAVPSRPWEQSSYVGTYGGCGVSNYNTGYGSGLYGSSYGGSYGGGLYGNNMYRGGYGGGMYGGGMYGGGTYNNGFGGTMGGYGVGMGSGLGPLGDQDPNNPFGAPPSPPGFWISFLRVMQGVVNFFGRISILIDQNTQAFHMFMTALLQLFDRSGMLYGELARFVLRILGVKTNPIKKAPEKLLDQKPPGGGPWDGVWQG